MEVHVYLHATDDLMAQFRAILNQGDKIMATLKDIQDAVAATTAAVAAETTVVNSVKVLIQGDSALIASLREQLAAAIAGGNDPAALQAVVDSLDAAHATLQANNDALAQAVVAGTQP